MKNQSLFRYGLVLKQEHNHNDIIFSFKQNNDRYSWISHFDFIIQKQTVYINNEEEKSDNVHAYIPEDSNDVENPEKSMQLLLKTLSIYNECIKNNETGGLITNLNTNYLALLQHFHNIIKSSQYI
eukprot:505932_1